MKPSSARSPKKVPQSRGMSAMLRRLATRHGAQAMTAGALLALGAHSASAQTTFNPGLTVLSGSGALGALTVNPGAALQFTSTGYTTTTAGGGPAGLITAGNGPISAADYAIFGTTDFAATTGATPFNIVAGSSVTGFYSTTLATGVNFDDTAASTTGSSAAASYSSIRFNTAQAETFVTRSGNNGFGGILVTPNVGAFDTSITGNGLISSRNGSGQGEIEVYQENTSGLLVISANINLPRCGSGNLVLNGPGTVVLSGPNTFNNVVGGVSGSTFLNGGFTEIGNSAELGQNTAAPLIINGGTLVGTASFALDGGTAATARAITIGNATSNANGGLAAITGQTLTVDNALTVAGTGSVIFGTGTLAGTGTGTSNPTAVVGNGNVSLLSAQTYTNPTTVSAGTLTVNHAGTNTGALAATPVTVSPGATLLVTGSTTLAGNVAVTGGAAAATQGSLSMIDGLISTVNVGGTLAVGDVNGGSQLGFDIGSGGTSDLLAVAGAVTPTGTTTINLAAPGGFSSGTYTLITAASGLGGAGFQLASNGSAFTSFSLANSTATQEILTIGGNAIPTTAFFTGRASVAAGDAANKFGNGNSTLSNFSTNKAGTTDTGQLPGAVTNLIFTANNAGLAATAGTLTTTLDNSYGINSLAFQVPTSTGITSSVINTTNGATNNTLTIGAGGLTVNSSADPTNPNFSSATISGGGSVVINGSQNWADNNNALGLTVSTGITTSSGANVLTLNGTGTAPVTLSGVIGNGSAGGSLGLALGQPGTTTIGGASPNTYTGGTTLNAGVIVAGGANALGIGVVNFGAGTTADLRLNGFGLTVGGLNTNATPGTPIVENANATAATLTDNAAATATYAGLIQDGTGGGALTLTKTGGAVQVLTGQNTYTGPTNINGGAINVGSASNPGVSGPLGGSGLISFGGGALQYSAANQFDYSGRFSTAAGQAYNIDTNGQNVTLATPLTSTTGSLFKQGLGTLTISGNSTFTGATTTTAGTLNLNGSSTSGNFLVTPGAGGRAIVNLSNPLTLSGTGAINVGATGTGAGATSILNIAPGTVISGGTGFFNAGQSALGVINMTGGSVTPGQYLVAGITNAGAVGVINLSGGSVTTNLANGGTLGATINTTGIFNVSGTGSYNSTNANTAAGIYVGESGTGMLNVSGTGLLTLGGGITGSTGLNIGRNSAATVSGTVNLGAVAGGGSGTSGGGTIITNVVQKTGALASGTFNFHGGTLQASPTLVTPAFMGGLTNAFVYGEGGTINNNAQAITISQALLAPTTGTGNGVSFITAAGTGYTPGGTPQIVITDSTGTGATAIGNVDSSGNLTVTVTNPGVNYTAPTVTVNGGGGTPGTLTPTLTTNTSGVLTFTGSGTTTLSNGASTYSGGTTISNGNLVLTNAAATSATGTGPVNDSGGNTAVLSGTGVSSGLLTVTNGSHLAPGVNTAANATTGIAGTAGVAGSLSVGSTAGTTLTNAALDYDLSATGDTGTPNAANDSITTGGTLTLGRLAFNFNALTGKLDNTGGATPGDIYTLITGASGVLPAGFNTASITTTFSGVNDPSNPFGYVPTYSATGGGLQVQFAPAPEPAQTATLGLIALGMGGLFLRARKRRAGEKSAA